MGNIQVSGLGYNIAPNWDFPVFGTNAGNMWYDIADPSAATGYGFHVVIGLGVKCDLVLFNIFK